MGTLGPLFTQPVLLQVLHSCPHLLAASTDAVTWHLEHLRQEFGEQQALTMISKCVPSQHAAAWAVG